MSSSGPSDHYGGGHQSSVSPGAAPSTTSPGQEKSPLSSLNMGFLKSLTEKRSTRDGPQKRRGPKPDSKPALTRRQELNRQAQRTHRERKELYIKALEDEVLRLKEVFSNVTQDKNKLAQENKKLRELIAQSGINIGNLAASDDMQSVGYPSTASVSGHSFTPGSHNAYTPPLTSQSTAPSVSPLTHSAPIAPPSNPSTAGRQMRTMTAQQGSSGQGLDYEQAGIDFVLTLERPCMVHLPWLLERSADGTSELCGHALMASCPPEPFPDLTSDIPFDHNHEPGGVQGTWALSKADLATLLDLSQKLDLDGEITPVMAWGMVLAHPRFYELKAEDHARLIEDLQSKVRCYGFGAVMEEFEVRDALNNVFSTKPDVMMLY